MIMIFCASLLLSFFCLFNNEILMSALMTVNLIIGYIVAIIAVFILYDTDFTTKWKKLILSLTVAFLVESLSLIFVYLFSLYHIFIDPYVSILGEFGFTCISYIIFGFGYRGKRMNDDMNSSDKKYPDNMWVALFLVAGCSVILGISFFIKNEVFPYYLILLCCGIVYVAVMFFIGYAMEEQRRAAIETATIKLLWERDKKNYELQKESIELINLKCHDLKRKMNQLKVSGRENDKEVKEIENAIKQYESVIETGNEVLNVIIADMFLRCEQAGIQFTYMIDGAYLKMMENMDIYSLFNNILDNAFEYEQKNIEKNSQFISLKVNADRKGIYIHEENYFIGEVEIVDGLIETTKADKDNHGFGMKSMHRVVKKYRGNLKVYVKADMFQIDVFLPFVQNALLYREEENFE